MLFAFPMSTDVVNPTLRDAEMLTANLAVHLLLAPVAGHNPVKRSCIFCIKIWPASIPYSFFAGLIPGDDSRFAIFVGFIKLYSLLDYLYLYYLVNIQALNWYRFFSDFEMLYLSAFRNYQASLRYQYWSHSRETWRYHVLACCLFATMILIFLGDFRQIITRNGF